ncbi:MAG: aminotransferase class I/II-fold pyridoxal phosphate-dependent enzyme [Clostridia bacterium]|nr:aminotransferase class I/II-fold pyridoxal phosphate-dependent enzyme [Clostridia bacterium]
MIYPQRMKKLMAEGIFLKLYEIKKRLINEGKSVVDLSVGSPSFAPSKNAMETLSKECLNPDNYRYAITDTAELRQAAASWYKRRFQVELNPESEITSLLGSQEGLAHICLALTDAGDIVMVHDPGYPIYHAGPQIAQNILYPMPCRENSALIDFDKIPPRIARKAKLMIVSYPNNPTTQIADESFYRQLVAFAKKYDIMVMHDNAYCELTYDGYRAGSFLNTPGAKDIGIELNSLSKTYNLAGIRVGFALGNSRMIKCISAIKSHMDYGIFIPVQRCAAEALIGDQSIVEKTRSAYEHRRNILCDGLASIGWNIEKPKATMFVWAEIPEHFKNSDEFAMKLASETGVIVTPGAAFGKNGENHVRMALVAENSDIETAVKNLRKSDLFITK